MLHRSVIAAITVSTLVASGCSGSSDYDSAADAVSESGSNWQFGPLVDPVFEAGLDGQGNLYIADQFTAGAQFSGRPIPAGNQLLEVNKLGEVRVEALPFAVRSMAVVSDGTLFVSDGAAVTPSGRASLVMRRPGGRARAIALTDGDSIPLKLAASASAVFVLGLAAVPGQVATRYCATERNSPARGNNLYIAKLDATGSCVWRNWLDSNLSDPAPFDPPYSFRAVDLSVSASGTVMLSDSISNVVSLFNDNGEPVHSFENEFESRPLLTPTGDAFIQNAQALTKVDGRSGVVLQTVNLVDANQHGEMTLVGTTTSGNAVLLHEDSTLSEPTLDEVTPNDTDGRYLRRLHLPLERPDALSSRLLANRSNQVFVAAECGLGETCRFMGRVVPLTQ